MEGVWQRLSLQRVDCWRKLPTERIEEPDCFSSLINYRGYWSALSWGHWQQLQYVCTVDLGDVCTVDLVVWWVMKWRSIRKSWWLLPSEGSLEADLLYLFTEARSYCTSICWQCCNNWVCAVISGKSASGSHNWTMDMNAWFELASYSLDASMSRSVAETFRERRSYTTLSFPGMFVAMATCASRCMDNVV